MERHFDEQLDALKLQLLKMCALAETMINDAIRILVQRDQSVAPAIQQHEQQVNKMQVEIDEICFTLIALHQPTAGDLRFILGAAKINTDLERLADQAVNICHKAERLIKEPPLKPFDIIPQMAVIASSMVKDSLHAYVNRETKKAYDVLLRDDQVDELKKQITRELLEYMEKNPATVKHGFTLLLVSRNLERIGDHATNIAETAIFVVDGKDVRHHT